jgi:hypothetical protein
MNVNTGTYHQKRSDRGKWDGGSLLSRLEKAITVQQGCGCGDGLDPSLGSDREYRATP